MNAQAIERKLLFAAHTQLIEWTQADATVAIAEGWGLFITNSNGVMRIGRIAEARRVRFPDDQTAITHVRRKLNARSDLHRRAWLLDGKKHLSEKKPAA